MQSDEKEKEEKEKVTTATMIIVHVIPLTHTPGMVSAQGSHFTFRSLSLISRVSLCVQFID
jgi:hypothetical protein